MAEKIRTQLELEDLERILQTSLQPVKPSNDFIQTLRNRLSDPIATRLPKTKMERNHYLIFGLATVLSGVLFAFTTGRILLAFGGAIGLARYLKTQSDARQLSTQRVIN
jgi:hypothetical protein